MWLVPHISLTPPSPLILALSRPFRITNLRTPLPLDSIAAGLRLAVMVGFPPATLGGFTRFSLTLTPVLLIRVWMGRSNIGCGTIRVFGNTSSNQAKVDNREAT